MLGWTGYQLMIIELSDDPSSGPGSKRSMKKENHFAGTSGYVSALLNESVPDALSEPAVKGAEDAEQ